MDSNMLYLLKELVKTAPTLQNGEIDAVRVLHEYLISHGVAAQIDKWDANRANVIARIGPEDDRLPTLVIGAHIDVVPASKETWNTDPFEPFEKDGFLYGRGCVDMLGGLSAFAAAMADVQASGRTLTGRVLLAATAGEETDSCGVKRFIQSCAASIKDPIGILIPEPTSLRLLRAHRGILWLKITTVGKTAHGSMPQLGINAIEKANLILDRLKTWQIPYTPHKLLGGCSMSINRIYGGTATNIVPDSCSIELDIRTLPDQSETAIIAEVRKVLSELAYTDPDFKADIAVLRACPALETKPDDPFVQRVGNATGIHETHAIGFTTDGPLFAQLNAPVLIFGPGDGARCHQPNEAIEIAQLEKAKALYINIIRALCI
ncbi:MAG: M20 family metallopeptidase [Planctomycetaceae bacterium]|nr:M20 family metallopeptidase [Planctomycetaceae bacterium]